MPTLPSLAVATPIATPVTPPPASPSEGNFFSTTPGRILIVVAIILLVVVVGLVVVSALINNHTINYPNSAPVDDQTPIITSAPVQTSSDTSDTTGWQSYTTQQLANSSLIPFVVKYPAGWSVKLSGDYKAGYSLALSKGSYMITIAQGFFGGATCTFSGDVPAGGLSKDLTGVETTDIDGTISLLRRYVDSSNKNSAKVVYSFCSSTDSATFTELTPIGRITYSTPANPDDTTLQEMDSILANISSP